MNVNSDPRPYSLYHSVLRVSLVVCAIALVFESGLVSQSTAVLSQNTHTYLANAVGMSAGVKPTELNQYTAALTQREQNLEKREAAVSASEREIEVARSGTAGTTSNGTATYIMAAILFVLLVLIVLNYVMDYLRTREAGRVQTV